MISIIIPVYNQADKLRATLNSIDKQTYRDLEIIIVNDGSTDNPEHTFTNFLEETKSELTYYFLNQKNLGAPAARNRGFKEAKGDYSLQLDSDIVLENDTIEILLKNIKF
jgi:glycosyltransferase involved in cell wall biosynthesis